MRKFATNCKIVKVECHTNITTGSWPSDSQYSYLSLTGHWINQAWKKKQACFHAQSFNDSHTGEHMKSVFTTCLEKWKLSDKLYLVLQDNLQNMVAALREANIDSVSCFAHTLQLIIKDDFFS